MPATAVPAPMSPPPDPPIYAVLTTPNPSHDDDNAGTFGSSIRAETPDETISRIACGVFRGHPSGTSAANETTSGVNGTTSGGGTYSPPLEEEQFPFF
ncbi:hypothetical protein BDA96_08G123200 [Sorghum bicolor]|uniref:Uncharacterized protein n=2 Tax=Sorghum bicolor TaxID=4558 RepID=A0A921QFP4_SORBI|nr:hypothetical protein BDA96_08G123200 [Sorghum bicolor]OQU79204.1 hypothetical protein SORBI_3008G110450 [Sorghum bicolor]